MGRRKGRGKCPLIADRGWCFLAQSICQRNENNEQSPGACGQITTFIKCKAHSLTLTISFMFTASWGERELDKWWRYGMKNYRVCWQLRNKNALKMGAQLLMDTWQLCWIEWFFRCLYIWCMVSSSKKIFKPESSCSGLKFIHSKVFVN